MQYLSGQPATFYSKFTPKKIANSSKELFLRKNQEKPFLPCLFQYTWPSAALCREENNLKHHPAPSCESLFYFI